MFALACSLLELQTRQSNDKLFDKCYQRTNVINPFGKFFMSVLWACVPVRVIHACD